MPTYLESEKVGYLLYSDPLTFLIECKVHVYVASVIVLCKIVSFYHETAF